jgi:hypothetical protein
MQYPGRIIKVGERDGAIVIALKRQLNSVLGIDGDPTLRLDSENANFGPKMKQVVKLFQARNVDREGRPLSRTERSDRGHGPHCSVTTPWPRARPPSHAARCSACHGGRSATPSRLAAPRRRGRRPRRRPFPRGIAMGRSSLTRTWHAARAAAP